MNEEFLTRIFESGTNALEFEGDRLGFGLRKDFDKIVHLEAVNNPFN